jgi:hypothetical protein
MLRVRKTSRTRPGPLVHVEHAGLGRGDAGRVLAAMLQHLQAVIEQLVDRASSRRHPEFRTSVHHLSELEPFRHRRRQPGLGRQHRGFQRRSQPGLPPPRPAAAAAVMPAHQQRTTTTPTAPRAMPKTAPRKRSSGPRPHCPQQLRTAPDAPASTATSTATTTTANAAAYCRAGSFSHSPRQRRHARARRHDRPAPPPPRLPARAPRSASPRQAPSRTEAATIASTA